MGAGVLNPTVTSVMYLRSFTVQRLTSGVIPLSAGVQLSLLRKVLNL